LSLLFLSEAIFFFRKKLYNYALTLEKYMADENIKFPQPDVSLQPKHLQKECSAGTRVFYFFLCT
jgi:hypothetical protein